MGSWNATVVGQGVHHNHLEGEPPGIPEDADRLFDEFVAKLRASGHTIFHASFTYGGNQPAREES